MSLYNFISLGGLVFIIFLGYLFSSNRKEINWHVMIWGVGLQMLIALFLFVFPFGVKIFLFINDVVNIVLSSAVTGAKFVFGALAVSPGTLVDGKDLSLGFILAFQAFPTIIFFSSLMAILYYYEIMPRIIRGFSYLFTRLMKISGAESLCAASNIFVGVESALTIKPYLRDMTRSEFCTILTAGMATVSSSVLGIYVFTLHDVFPTIAGHLVSASFISAPAAVVMAKLLLPETETPKTLGEHINIPLEKETSVFEAIINGANAGVRLIVGIVALLIAILGLVALLDQILFFLGTKLNGIFNWSFSWSLSSILGLIFYPFTVILGMPLADAKILAPIIGERMILTEVTSYQHLSEILKQDILKDPRSAVIATYALCGFAHVASLAIFIGGISALVPERTKTLAQVGLRSLLAATLACLMTACIAGIFFSENSLLLR